MPKSTVPSPRGSPSTTRHAGNRDPPRSNSRLAVPETTTPPCWKSPLAMPGSWPGRAATPPTSGWPARPRPATSCATAWVANGSRNLLHRTPPARARPGAEGHATATRRAPSTRSCATASATRGPPIAIVASVTGARRLPAPAVAPPWPRRPGRSGRSSRRRPARPRPRAQPAAQPGRRGGDERGSARTSAPSFTSAPAGGGELAASNPHVIRHRDDRSRQRRARRRPSGGGRRRGARPVPRTCSATASVTVAPAGSACRGDEQS